MGFALWLIPSSVEQAGLSRLMEYRPHNSSLPHKSKSYPSFPPHITITTFEPPLSGFKLEQIVLPTGPVVTFFASVKRGDSYKGALGLNMEKTQTLKKLYEDMTARLDQQGFRRKENRSFPHMSLFYVDEPEERKRLQCEFTGFVKDSQSTISRRLALIIDPRGQRVAQYTGSEVWLVDCCSKKVEEWHIIDTISLSQPPRTQASNLHHLHQ